jgi:hypothetical protein
VRTCKPSRAACAVLDCAARPAALPSVPQTITSSEASPGQSATWCFVSILQCQGSGARSSLTCKTLPLQPPRRRTQNPAAEGDVAMDEPEVAALSQAQRDRLLRAFDMAGQTIASAVDDPDPRRRRKRRKVGVIESPPASDAGGGGFVPPGLDEAGGGFLPPDNDDDAGGGFVVDDDMDGGGFLPLDDGDADAGGFVSEPPPPAADVSVGETAADDAADEYATPARTHLPLSLIPAALQLAGLPPSDPEVLEFFRQSAEGWAGEDGEDDAEAGNDGPHERRGVSRKDFMSVCAVLLASRGAGDDEDETGAVSDEAVSSGLSDPDEDEYRDEAEDPELDFCNPARRRTRRTTRSVAQGSPTPSLPSDGPEETSSASDDFERSKPSRQVKGSGKTSGSAKGRRTKTSRGSLVASGGRPELSRGEKRAAREAFALFFPPSPGPAVDEKILTVGMVAAVVKDLKESHVSADLVRRRPAPAERCDSHR